MTNCLDAGAGSLRDTTTAASDGDMVVLAQLTDQSPGCANADFPLFPATISLTTGAIAVDQADLIFIGPGADNLLITRASTGAVYDRIVTHTNTGKLQISDVSLSGGYPAGPYLKGGCVSSQGNVTLDHVQASACKAAVNYVSYGYAYGGAVYAKGTVTINNSTLSENVASTPRSAYTRGGAIFARGNISVTNSQLTNNKTIGNSSNFDFGAWVYGGAIAGHADVTIVTSTLDHNSAQAAGCYVCTGGGSPNPPTNTHYSYIAGGAIFAGGKLTLTTATLSNNSAVVTDNSGTVTGAAYGYAAGGAVVAKGDLVASNSTISGNLASAPTLLYNAQRIYLNSTAGGVLARAGLSISGSTIAGNTASGLVTLGGGLVARDGPPDANGQIDNSTISGNSALLIGGVFVGPPATIRNSTIAFNTAGSTAFAGGELAAGLVAAGSTATLINNLISNNTTAPHVNTATNSTDDDFNTGADLTATSSNNLMRVISPATKALVPAATITGSCPLLGPLRDNGGPTPTHALMTTSPAIDAGTASGLLNDQRGAPYARASGSSTDIGAYEAQQNEIIFTAGLDGCLP